MKNGKVPGIAPLDLKGCKIMKNLSIKGSAVEENHDVSLQIEKIEEGGSFVKRLLSREEDIGQSSCSYYRAPVQGRVPFDWEAEPGKPKTNVKKEGESGRRVLPLSPPPILRGRNADNLGKSCSCRRKVGLFQKIKDFLQGKPLAKSRKLRQKRRSTLGDLMRHPEQGCKDKLRSASVAVDRTRASSGGSDWEIYGDTEDESDFVAFRYSVG